MCRGRVPTSTQCLIPSWELLLLLLQKLSKHITTHISSSAGTVDIGKSTAPQPAISQGVHSSIDAEPLL
jgi:hypothetical protein